MLPASSRPVRTDAVKAVPIRGDSQPDSLDQLSDRRKSLAFFTLVIALVLEIVDLTIVNTALPSIQAGFGGSSATMQWVVAAYALSFSLLLILGARLGDVFGSRGMFLLGVAGFTAASIACGIAQTGGQLVAARVLQGAFGAMMAPQVLSMMQLLYTPVERIARLSWFGIIGGVSALAGPILGGLLMAANVGGFGWRAVFLINGPIGLVALIAGTLLLPTAPRQPNARIDGIGASMFGVAIAALLFPLMRGERTGFGVADAALLVAGATCLILAWISLKRRARDGGPTIFDPALMNNSSFRLGIAVLLVFSAANTGFLFTFAYALQRLAYRTPLETGLIHIPFTAGVMIGMGLIGRHLATRAEKWILVAGALTLALFGSASLAWIQAATLPLWMLLPMLVLAGAGMGMCSGPATPIALARVERSQAGSASGIVKTVQQMGGAFGVAFIGGAFFAYRNERTLVPAAAAFMALLLLCATLAGFLPRHIFHAAQKQREESDCHTPCSRE